MKKIFLVALAAIGMTACMQDEVVEIANGGAIAFENAFVGNATKAVVTTDNLEAFQVWGYVNQPSGKLFEGTEVTKAGDAWTYQGTQYWAPENEYHFAAIAPGSSQWALDAYPGTLTFENNGTTDLIYAAKKVTSAAAGNTNSAVAFQFDHLLSKVKLNFTNGFPTDNVTVALTEIKMATPQTAEMAIASGEACVWANFGANKDFTFADKQLAYAASATTEEYFILPYDAVISFKVNVLVGNQPVYTGVKTATLPAATFEMGHAYNLSAVINADVLNFDEIEFTVNKVEAWTEAPNASDKAANLIYAAQVGGTYTLKEDVLLDAPVVVPAGVDFVLDLNGYNITSPVDAFEVAGGSLTINGDGIVYAASGNEAPYCAVWAYGDGYVRINGGEYKIGYPAGDYNDLIYAKENAKIDIYGGYFHNSGKENAFVLNIKDNSNADITVYGGTFEKFNPADNASENPAKSFVAAGYSVSENNGVYTVDLATVATTAALQAAINEGQSPIYLAANTTFEGTVVMKSNITIEGLEGSTMHCVNLNGAQNVTLYNITFDAAGAAMSYGGDNKERYYANIFSRDNSNSAKVAGAKNLVIDGCHFTGTFPGEGGCVTSFADQTKTGSHNITIKNCIFDIENCGYAIYGYYTGDNAGNFVIENNTFKTATFANTIYLGRYMSSNPVVLKDNTFEKVSTLNRAIYVQDHSNYGVSVDASGNTFAN